MKRLLLILLIGSAIISACSTSNSNFANNHPEQYINVEYRDSNVNVNSGDFIYSDLNSSSFLGDAWYDTENGYLILEVSSKYYHYCDLWSVEWYGFTTADSHGTYYNSYIKDNYDCRNGTVPTY